MPARGAWWYQQKQQREIPQTFKTLSRRLIRIAHLNRHLRIAATEMALKD